MMLLMYFLYIPTIISKKSLQPSVIMKRNHLTNSDYIKIFRIENQKTSEIIQDTTIKIQNSNEVTNRPYLKFISQWTCANTVPFMYMEKGRSEFIKRNCTYTNCYVTNDRQHLELHANFDVIIFAGPQLRRDDLPEIRSGHQKYAFVSIESAENYPVCDDKFDNFYNWSWTYRLDSELRWGYLVIKNKEGEVIGPQKEMHWMRSEDMAPVDQSVKDMLKNKSKAVAWFVTNCLTKSKRDLVAKVLQAEVEKYDLTLDIYGKCGILECTKDTHNKCNSMLEKDYYFYLSFENSFDEDYVTEKLLHPLLHNVVPIVYGGANYTRFMPDGMYLNVIKMGMENLASAMHRLINNPDEYANFFRWKKYYSYHYKSDSTETDDYCSICALLNDENKVRSRFIYKNFQKW